ncbi:hypothetical protein LBMAG49_04330 [Planctomycetota bacterium]|nr:hypothetical protein LBMAG49_04330 [Planctomycetota bacterium]
MQELANLESKLGTHAAAMRVLALEVCADRKRLPVVFPGLPRRFGKDLLREGRITFGTALLDLGAFRTCDLAAALLLLQVAVTEAEGFDLYEHGDIEERAMLLRALHVLAPSALTVRMLGEVQRTNMVLHLEAACCDGDLLRRTVGQPGFGVVEQNRMLLKIAFLDLPLARVFHAEQLANQELSRMLQDLATEREAAGRSIWRDTDRLISRAPVAGTIARILGGLEHGDDGRRLAAVEGLILLNRKDLAPFAIERLAREPRDVVRKLLVQAAG